MDLEEAKRQVRLLFESPDSVAALERFCNDKAAESQLRLLRLSQLRPLDAEEIIRQGAEAYAMEVLMRELAIFGGVKGGA